MTENGNGPAPAGPRTITLGGDEVRIEPPSGRKASRAFALLRAIGNDGPELVAAWGEYANEYQRSHFIELDRAQAMFRYGPEPLVVEGEVVRYEAGHPRAGEPVMLPGPLESMSDEAWRSVDNKLRLPQSPSTTERAAAMLKHEALEAAEENVYRLLALFTLTNADVARYRKDGSLAERLDERAAELLDDAGIDELVELAVVVGEVIDDQFRRKAEALGGRMGNALRALGIDPAVLKAQTTPQGPQTTPQEEEETPTDGAATSTPTPSSSRQTSSTDSPAGSDGAPTPPSSSTGASSEPSTIGSSASG